MEIGAKLHIQHFSTPKNTIKCDLKSDGQMVSLCQSELGTCNSGQLQSFMYDSGFVAFGLKYLRVRCKQRELEKHGWKSGEKMSERNTAQ